MYNVQVPETAEIYTDWYIEFATNSLGLAYTSQSLYTDEIDSSNWYEIISRPDVKVGISDPRLDSCGYRTLMVCQLAELYFEDESIMDGITGGFSPPVTVDGDNGVYSVSVPEIVAPQKAVLRGSSMRLLAILESGDIDYAFMYKSMAEQYGLGFLELPSEINLGSDGYKELVEELKVTLSFQRFASVNPEFSCQPIVYGITIPQNAPHPELAMELVQFIMGPEGQRILQDAHQPLTVPLRIDNPDNLPGELVFLTEQGSNY